jgi:hypothetical protein
MRTFLSALLMLSPLPAFAGWSEGEHDVCMHETSCRVASTTELDELRGGLDVDTRHGGRLRVDIGITRAVSVNDRVVAVSHFGAGHPSVTIGQSTGNSAPLSSQLRINDTPVPNQGAPLTFNGQALVVQNGPGNLTPMTFGSGATPTIVQNSLDNQTLKTFTFINASLNSLSVMRQLMMNDMVGRAITGSGR